MGNGRSGNGNKLTLKCASECCSLFLLKERKAANASLQVEIAFTITLQMCVNPSLCSLSHIQMII